MLKAGPAKRLRIYLGENDKADGLPLYEALVLKARAEGLAGATVFRGPLGFGHGSHIHTAKILRLSQDLPMVVEIVDRTERIDAFVETVKAMVGQSLVTTEAVDVVWWGEPRRPTPGG